MANRNKPSQLKRQRELKKAEKAAQKREDRARRGRAPADEAGAVASRDELESYGALIGPGDDVSRRQR
jgi:hypothetical protein